MPCMQTATDPFSYFYLVGNEMSNTCLGYKWFCVTEIQRYKDVEELGRPSVSKNLLPTAVQKDFEMEILERSGQWKDVSVQLMIPSPLAGFSHANWQANPAGHFLPPDSSNRHTSANTTHTDLHWLEVEKQQMTTRTTRLKNVNMVEKIMAEGINRKLISSKSLFCWCASCQ